MASVQSSLPYVGQALPARTVWASGGDNLFALAARYLGDATLWYTIAEINAQACTDPTNGLINPWIQGLVQLTLPTVTKSNGGIPRYG